MEKQGSDKRYNSAILTSAAVSHNIIKDATTQATGGSARTRTNIMLASIKGTHFVL